MGEPGLAVMIHVLIFWFFFFPVYIIEANQQRGCESCRKLDQATQFGGGNEWGGFPKDSTGYTIFAGCWFLAT